MNGGPQRETQSPGTDGPLGGLAGVLRPDAEGLRLFDCRPLTARSSECNTVFGLFRGEIGLGAVPDFKAALYDLGKDDAVKVILDFKETSLSRSAIGTLLAFAASVFGRNRRLYLYRPSPQLRAALRDLGLKDFFTTLESEDDVVAALVP